MTRRSTTEKKKKKKQERRTKTKDINGKWKWFLGANSSYVQSVDCMRTEVLVPNKQLRGNSAETKGQLAQARRHGRASGWATLSLQI